MRKKIILLSFILSLNFIGISQPGYIDYSSPKKYTIAGLSISGVEFLSIDALKLLSGLEIGQAVEIPGFEISRAIDKLWSQGLFSDVKISITQVVADSVWLDIYLQEQPRLNQVHFYGINSSQESDLREKLDLSIGKQVTDNMLRNSEIIIQKYYSEKGFPFVSVDFKVEDDSIYQNTVNVSISIDKKNRVRIENLVIRGNIAFKENKVKRIFKETKGKNIFRFWKPSKFIEDKYKEDKDNLIAKYNKEGYRDARIIEDSVFLDSNNQLVVFIKIDEGKKYYFRKIEWIGNTKYTDEQLSKLLDIHQGDPYNQEKLQNRLMVDEDAVGNLYYDDGYLFFQAVPQELNIENDSVDIRIMISEGQQARINDVVINGNTRTNDYVIRRDLRTLPGELFSKTDLIRSVRELANLGNFDPEQLAPNPIPNPSDGSVDIQYTVVERPNDMFELSGGWGYYGFMLQVGISFNNFSMKNILKPKFWDPLPIGDGQKFSIRATTSGLRYQMYSVSFVNPWFGGKKPNSFSVSLYYNRMTNASIKSIKPTAFFNVLGASLGLGRRLKFPDDYFVLSHQLSYDRYYVDDYRYYLNVGNGTYNLISFTNILSRSSIDNPLYTRKGADISMTLKLTPPYSMITGNKSWSNGSDSLKFRWAELYRFDFKFAWYNEIVKNLVLSARFEYGMLGFYNKNIGYTPFEGFDVGGSGFANYNFGVDYVALRGYKDHSLANAEERAAKLYTKYTLELRYPVILKEMATMYLLGFAEAGNAWYNINEYNPFNVKRSVGVGGRLFIPMLGLVGLDVGYGFDPINGSTDNSGWNYHFTFGQQF